MRSSLIAVVLCISAHAAAAQCVATVGNVPDDTRQGVGQGVERIRTRVVTAPPIGALRPGAELVTTATAGTRNATTAMREAPAASTGPEEEHPRRAGPAMLLAALALMSGIALRRYGAGKQ